MNIAFRAGAAAAAVALSSLAFADLPREGTYDFTTCFKRNQLLLDYSPTQTIWSYDQRGTAKSEVPGGLFDGDDIQCVGMSALLDGKRYGNSACISTAKDGSKRLTRNWYDEQGKVQGESVAGSGRYDGLVTKGTVKTVKDSGHTAPGQLATVEICTRGEGTYRLK